MLLKIWFFQFQTMITTTRMVVFKWEIHFCSNHNFHYNYKHPELPIIQGWWKNTLPILITDCIYWNKVKPVINPINSKHIKPSWSDKLVFAKSVSLWTISWVWRTGRLLLTLADRRGYISEITRILTIRIIKRQGANVDVVILNKNINNLANWKTFIVITYY